MTGSRMRGRRRITGGVGIDGQHRRSWADLVRLRRVAIASMIVAPFVAAGIGILLHSFGFASWTRFAALAIVVPFVTSRLARLRALPCPRCRKSFSSSGRVALHLSNKECVHCGGGWP